MGVCGKEIMPLVCARICVRGFQSTDHRGEWKKNCTGAFICEYKHVRMHHCAMCGSVCREAMQLMLMYILYILLMQVFADRKSIFFHFLELLELIYPSQPLLWNCCCCCCCWAAETTWILSHNRHPDTCQSILKDALSGGNWENCTV